MRNLSQVFSIDPHIQDIVHELENQSDRGVALITAAIVDIALQRLMRCRMVDFADFDEIMIHREGAPLGTFADRIRIARGFGVIGPLAESHMHTIRLIRNQFAHSPLKIDFAHELIAQEIDKLPPDQAGNFKPHWTPQKRRFVGTATIMISALEERVRERLPDKITVWTS